MTSDSRLGLGGPLAEVGSTLEGIFIGILGLQAKIQIELGEAKGGIYYKFLRGGWLVELVACIVAGHQK